MPLIALFTLFLLASLARAFHLQFNVTPSMPIGFYEQMPVAQIKRGDNVAVCLPSAVAKLGRERGYLATDHCTGNAMAVLKQVIAIPHDTVTVNHQGIMVNGQHYVAPYQAVDHQGHSVKKFIHNGTYHTQGYWLYGSHSPRFSWDSRYYGAVAKPAILGVYQPLWVF